nr:MAG TPA: hypothetical protein [Caudoviricetes sp.]
MEEKEFFTREQAVMLISLLIQQGAIAFPISREQLAWLTNDERIERLDAIGETLLALLRQMTGKPDLKPSESEGLLREVKRLEEDPDRPNPPDEENPF